jgi:hypothetical protein
MNPMFVNYFWQQYVIGIRDALGHLVGLLCIKFRENILIINVARPVLLEFAELADSPIYPPSSIHYINALVLVMPYLSLTVYYLNLIITWLKYHSVNLIEYRTILFLRDFSYVIFLRLK